MVAKCLRLGVSIPGRLARSCGTRRPGQACSRPDRTLLAAIERTRFQLPWIPHDLIRCVISVPVVHNLENVVQLCTQVLFDLQSSVYSTLVNMSIAVLGMLLLAFHWASHAHSELIIPAEGTYLGLLSTCIPISPCLLCELILSYCGLCLGFQLFSDMQSRDTTFIYPSFFLLLPRCARPRQQKPADSADMNGACRLTEAAAGRRP